MGGAVLTKKHQQLRKTMLAQEVRKEHHAFSAEEVADFRRAFNSMDTDSSGGIDADEVKAVLQRFGQNPSDEELRQMVADVDEDGSGELGIEESVMTKEYYHLIAPPQSSTGKTHAVVRI